jgi:hypothetical protein
MLRAGSHRIYLARTFGRNVDASGFFENQLTGGTWMTFDQSISGIRVQSIVTNFDGSLNTTPLVRSSLMHGSYIKVNGTVVTSDHTLSIDGTNNSLAVGGSASFSGTGQYLSTNNAGLNLTGDFTVEGWFYPTNVTGFHAVWTFGQASTGRYTVQLSGTSVLSNLYGAGSTTYTSTVPINTWTHIAMVRSGTTVKVYINGTASATTDTQSGTIGNGGYLNIGADDSGATNFAGRITNFRVVNGTAVYTTNFTPSVNPLLPVINTKLLLTELTESALVADTGPSRLTLTNNGSVTWTSATPFTTGVTTTAPNDPAANQYGVGFWMQRGHTIVVLNPTDGTIRPGWPKCYDTYGTPTTSCDSMVTDLLAVASGDVVAIGTFDATSCNQNLRDALTNLFGAVDYTTTWSQVRTSHMFLGKRNQYRPGLYLSNYSGYFSNGLPGVQDTPALVSTQWFDNHTGNLTTTVAGDTLAYFGVSGTVVSKQWVGYFKPLVTSNYQFYINSDDACYVWVGTKAISSYNNTNFDLFGRSGSPFGPNYGPQTSSVIALTAGQYYPIRIQWGNRVAGGELTVSWSNSVTAKTNDFTGLLFYNTAGAGF